MSRYVSRLGIMTVATAVVLVAASSAWAQATIKCESDGGYKYCPINTYGKAILVKEISSGVCVGGTNWAYDRKGVWVDKGCKGEFEVNTAWPGGKPGGSKKPAADPKANVPKWAVGTFKTTVADWDNTPLEFTIGADGIATVKTVDGEFYGRFFEGFVRVAQPGGMTYELKKSRDGVVATDLRNRAHRVLQMARASN